MTLFPSKVRRCGTERWMGGQLDSGRQQAISPSCRPAIGRHHTFADVIPAHLPLLLHRIAGREQTMQSRVRIICARQRAGMTAPNYSPANRRRQRSRALSPHGCSHTAERTTEKRKNLVYIGNRFLILRSYFEVNEGHGIQFGQ